MQVKHLALGSEHRKHSTSLSCYLVLGCRVLVGLAVKAQEMGLCGMCLDGGGSLGDTPGGHHSFPGSLILVSCTR